MSINTQQKGFGVEAECFILNSEGRPIEMVQNIPSSEFIKDTIIRKFPCLDDRIGFEQVSVMLELKSEVTPSVKEAFREVLQIRNLIESEIRIHGVFLVFTPVLQEDFEFVPATRNQNSKTHENINNWSEKTDIKSAATASLQINDSTVFDTENNMEKAREIFNSFIHNKNTLLELNQDKKSFLGLSRVEHATDFLKKIKSKQFKRHGFDDPNDIVFPKAFLDTDSLQKWMQAHSDVASFAETEHKNEHSILCKIKREGDLFILESRFADSVETEIEAERITRKIEQVLDI